MDSNSTNNKHENTIFIIEIAVLTIFCFACLGVIIASLCLLKMRQSSSKMLSKHRNASKIRQRPSSSNNNKKKEKHKSFQYELSASLGILLQFQQKYSYQSYINTDDNSTNNQYSPKYIYEYESNNDSHNKLVLVMDCEFGNYVCYELKIVYELKNNDTSIKDGNNLKLHQ